FAGLVPDLELTLAAQRGDDLRHGGVDRARALRAAEHEQAQRTATAGEPRCRWRQRGDLRTYRVADGLVRDAREAVREAAEHAARDARQRAIRHAGRLVLFVHEQWPAQEPGRESTRARGVTAEADHRARLRPAHRAER